MQCALGNTVFFSCRGEDAECHLIVAGHHKSMLRINEGLGACPLFHLLEVDGLVGLVYAARAVFELRQQDELTLSASLLKLFTIHLNRDPGHQALMNGELASRDTDRPSNLGLPAFHDPLLEWNTCE